MWPRDRTVGFVLKLLLLYGLLAAPWPGVRGAYSVAYRAAANLVFGSFGGGVVRFRASPSGREEMDAEIVIRNRRSPVAGTTPHNSRMTGYLPTAEVIALILATPIPWPRRWRALLWGVVLVHGFVALRLVITLLHWFSVEEPWALYDPSPFWGNVLSTLFEFAVLAPTCTFLVPALIWILVTFRRSDWATIVENAPRKSPPRAT